MRVGWLADEYLTVIGGAELCVKALAEERPRRTEIVPCPPGEIATDVDVYAIHNCTTYRIGEVVTAVRDKPFVKVVYEQWWFGDPALRSWLLSHANLLLFLSQPHIDTFPWPLYDEIPRALIPTIVDLTRFRDWSWGNVKGRQRGVMWMAQMTGTHKGIEPAVRWAVDNDTPVDFYGGGPLRFRPHNFVKDAAEGALIRDMGQVPYKQVPVTMQNYQRFLFLPTILDTCSRTIFEARASGLDLITNENVGAMWWIENRPEDIERGREMFWDHVFRVVNEEPRGTIGVDTEEASTAVR